MKDFKVKQILFHKLNTVDDFIETIEHKVLLEMNDHDIVHYCLDYLTKEVETIFPAKSYIVAVIYSLLLKKYFEEDIIVSLSDPNLFLGTDKYFVTYHENKKVYDEILQMMKKHNLLDVESNKTKQVKKTVFYFEQEFLGQYNG